MTVQQIVNYIATEYAGAVLIAGSILSAYVTLYALHHLRRDVFGDTLVRGVGWWRSR